MPECKSFVLRVNDGALGHAYIVDIPKGENSCRPAFLYQSDLGEGVTRKLRFEDWMTHKALTPILLDDIKIRQIWSRLQRYLILMEMLKCYERKIFNIKSMTILVSSCLSMTPIILKKTLR